MSWPRIQLSDPTRPALQRRRMAPRAPGTRVCLLLALAASAIAAAAAAYGPPPEEWAKRSVLQVLTDRFALPDCPSKPRRCKDLNNACGGTHVGLRQRLDYIQGMGFDALWISPVTSQTGGPVFNFQDGWHGYWPKDLWNLNSILGTPTDFAALTKAMHKRGMWVMLDVVPNHSGYFKAETLHEMTFDKPEYYHSCTGCDPETCGESKPEPVGNQTIECRLIGLPDINQSHPHVAKTLYSWIDWVRDTYEIDGFRVDAAKHMYPEFLRGMKQRSRVLTIGESFYADWLNGTNLLADMLTTDQLHSMLSYTLYFAAEAVFMGPSPLPEETAKYQMMNTTTLKDAVEHMMKKLPGHVHIMGNFLDNHDRGRLSEHGNMDDNMILNALAFNFFVPGIPIVFYGTEARLSKPNQPLWEDWDWDTTEPLYVQLKLLNWYRRQLKLWEHGYQTLAADGLVYAFARGDAALVVLSGQAAKLNFDRLPRQLALSNLPAAWRGKTLTNIFDTQDKLEVRVDGTADLELRGMQPLVFVQDAVLPSTFVPQPPAKWLVPVDYVVLMVTLACMLLVTLAIKWVMQPQRLDRLSAALSRDKGAANCGGAAAPSTPVNSVTAKEAAAAKLSDGGLAAAGDTIPVGDAQAYSSGGGSSCPLDAAAKQKAHLAKLTGGSMRKDDSAADLQKLPSLRAMAALDGSAPQHVKTPSSLQGDGEDDLIAAGSPGGAITRLDPGTIMHVAMEYSIPHLGLTKEFLYGGLGMVVDLFAKFWPGDMVLCAPLYAAAYESASAQRPKFADGPAVMKFEVPVGHQVHVVEVFELNVCDQPPAGNNRRYLLLQSDVFRHRSRGDIYSFSSEHDMIAWLSVWNQAVAHVIHHWGVKRVQLHDYHGALSMQYLPHEEKPKVLYVAHNAHYNGVFALPTKQRRAYLYDMFNLNPAAVSKYTEHKSSFDTLHSLLTHMIEAQKGVGCAAVSPNYASEIRSRLSPFWQMPAGAVIGITNAMDPTGTWAGQGLSVDDVLARKTAAKLQLQQRMGLTVGEDYKLAIFMGRLTHQKGVDVIAEAAPQVLARHPKLQLIVVGPLGDVAGAEAQQALGQLATAYPNRLVAPANKYIDGDEKKLILAAADFCLCPSRYEPCGLVDIEFGWYGSLIIGHETGGLGKMPGFYFKSAAATVPHLGAKLASAFGAALGTSLDGRKQMIRQALDKRFSLDVQMDAYQQLWNRIDGAVAETRGRLGTPVAAAASSGTDPDSFFAQSWLKRNLTLQSLPPVATCSVSVAPTKAVVPGAITEPPATPSGGAKKSAKLSYQEAMNQLSAKHTFSSYLVLLLQSVSLLPSLLLIGYMILQQISRQTWGTCPLAPHDEEWLPVLNPLGLRVLWQLILSTAAAPVWTVVAFKKSPRDYVVLVCMTTLASLVVVLLSFIWQEAMNAALLLVSPMALAGLPLVSLGFMGCNHELSEVGYKLMSVSDAAKCVLLAGCAALAAFATSYTTFLAVAAVACVVVTAATAWLVLPDVLPPGYTHMKLNMCWREQRVVLMSGPACQYITLAISVLDMAGLSLLGLLLSSLWGVSGMVAANCAGFGAAALGVLVATGVLQSRAMQLHVHSATLLLAALPGAVLLKAVAAWQLPALWQVLLAVACVEVAIGGARGPLNGLLAMMTLPSREAAAIWQLMVVMCSNVTMLGVVAAVLGMRVDPEALVVPLLVCCGAVEGLRLLCGALLARFHPRENLCAL